MGHHCILLSIKGAISNVANPQVVDKYLSLYSKNEGGETLE
jgi:hypothetical protein